MKATLVKAKAPNKYLLILKMNDSNKNEKMHPCVAIL